MAALLCLANIKDIIEAAEKAKGYWDETGLDMHIAVKSNKQITVSSKHWARVHYIQTKISPSLIWENLAEISNDIGRKYIRSEKGPYVYVNNLNITQTQEVFDKLVEGMGCSKKDVSRVW